jgi:hypothetical protein
VGIGEESCPDSQRRRKKKPWRKKNGKPNILNGRRQYIKID